MNRREKCGFFANEQLILSFSDDQLLMEDLSGTVPKGSSLLLRKTEFRKNNECVCEKMESFWDNTWNCTFFAEIEVLNTKL